MKTERDLWQEYTTAILTLTELERVLRNQRGWSVRVRLARATKGVEKARKRWIKAREN